MSKEEHQNNGVPLTNIITQVRKDDGNKDQQDELAKQNQYSPNKTKPATENAILKFARQLCRCLIIKKKPPPVMKFIDTKLVMGVQPVPKKGKKTLVLDLDETLVHSTFEHVANPDLQLNITVEGTTLPVYVMIRPGVDEFLKRMAEIYEIVLFTASLKEYAEPLLAKLDPNKYIDTQLYRDSCTVYQRRLVKDLTRLGRKLKDIMIVDNAEYSFAFQPTNGILIKSFFDDKCDNELENLTEFLEFMSDVYDCRPIPLWKHTYEASDEIKYEDTDRNFKLFTKRKPSNPSTRDKDDLAMDEEECLSEDHKNDASIFEMLTAKEILQHHKALSSFTDRVPDQELKKFAQKFMTDREVDPTQFLHNLNLQLGKNHYAKFTEDKEEGEFSTSKDALKLKHKGGSKNGHNNMVLPAFNSYDVDNKVVEVCEEITPTNDEKL